MPPVFISRMLTAPPHQKIAAYFIFFSFKITGYLYLMPNISNKKDKAAIERDEIKNIAVAYQKNQVEIHNSLNEEFIDNLPKWNASIDKHTLSF